MTADKLYEKRSLNFTGAKYKDVRFPYRLLTPKDFAPQAALQWPLIVFLHGAGERGDDNSVQLKFFPAEMTRPENRDRYRAFLLVPQCPMDAWWPPAPFDYNGDEIPKDTSDEEKAVLAMIAQLRKEFPIDARRIYLTGLSMGGFGCWDLATRYPDLWAAVAPICGGGFPNKAAVLKDLPLWAFHGGKDDVVKPELSRAMIEAIRKAGGSPRYTEFPQASHDSWTPAYRSREFLDWMFAQKRK